MSIEIDTFELHYKKPLDGGLFLAGIDSLFESTVDKLRDTFKIYEGVAKRIIRERNIVRPGTADWGYYPWSGLMVSIHLDADEGFDALHDYYEYLSFQTQHSFAREVDRCAEPKPQDYALIMRRAWVFRVGDSRCTLCAFASDNSQICKKVETGMEPTYELVCEGSQLKK